MVMLPIFGLLAGGITGRSWALIVTALAAAIGFALVAILTDEISGWGDGYVWVDTFVSLFTTWLGILIHKWISSHRGRRSASRL